MSVLPFPLLQQVVAVPVVVAAADPCPLCVGEKAKPHPYVPLPLVKAKGVRGPTLVTEWRPLADT